MQAFENRVIPADEEMYECSVQIYFSQETGRGEFREEIYRKEKWDKRLARQEEIPFMVKWSVMTDSMHDALNMLNMKRPH